MSTSSSGTSLSGSGIINFNTSTPAELATDMAQSATAGQQSVITTGQSAASTQASALSSLENSLGAFQAALQGLSSNGSTMTSYNTTYGAADTGAATATPSSGVEPGTYQFTVGQLASAYQALYSDFQPITAPTSSAPDVLTLTQPNGTGGAIGTDLSIDLSKISGSGPGGTITASDLATAINNAGGNNGAIVASVVTVGSSTSLQLTSGATGADSTISVSATTGSPLANYFSGTTPDVLQQAQDAEFVYGTSAATYDTSTTPATLVSAGGGITVDQASNTFSGINGLSVDFSQAGSVNLTVAQNQSGTAQNVQNFVNAYNTLYSQLSQLMSAGNPAENVAAGPLANNAQLMMLQQELENILNPATSGVTGLSMVSLGITTTTSGTLAFSSTALNKTLATDPTAVDQVFGTTGAADSLPAVSGSLPTGVSGILGQLDWYMNDWLDSSSGQISTLQASVQQQQKQLQQQQTNLTTQYNSLYQNYLTEFSNLEQLELQMTQTSSLFSTGSSSG